MTIALFLCAVPLALPFQEEGPAKGGSGWVIEELDAPGERTARWPSLGVPGSAVDSSRAWLVWTEDVEGGQGLYGASFEDESWSDPVAIASGAEWFVNWADAPRIGVNGSVLVATWLDRLGGGTYAYGVRFKTSADRGKAWSTSRFLHSDRSPTEHGFASLVPLGDGGFAALWLDGRGMGSDAGPGTMAVRTTVIGKDGSIGDEIQLDERVCECCPTDMVALADGSLVVAYRDRSEAEVRDIVVQRGRPGDRTSWKRARFLLEDGWRIPGCPVNGPSLDARENRVALAWYTGAEARAHVRVAFSDAGVSSFGRSVDCESVNAVGRVQVAYMNGGAAVVWMDEDPEIGSNWFVRWVGEDLVLEEALCLGSAKGDRRAGYPTLQRLGDRLLCLFTDVEYGGLRAFSLRRR